MSQPSTVVEFETSVGMFAVELYTQHAPRTCFNFAELAKIGMSKSFSLNYSYNINYLTPISRCFANSTTTNSFDFIGYYDGTVFHRYEPLMQITSVFVFVYKWIDTISDEGLSAQTKINILINSAFFILCNRPESLRTS